MTRNNCMRLLSTTLILTLLYPAQAKRVEEVPVLNAFEDPNLIGMELEPGAVGFSLESLKVASPNAFEIWAFTIQGDATSEPQIIYQRTSELRRRKSPLQDSQSQ